MRISWNSAEASRHAYVACLLLLCQGKSVWLLFRRFWVWIPAGSRIFFSLSQQKQDPSRHSWRIYERLLSSPVNADTHNKLIIPLPLPQHASFFTAHTIEVSLPNWNPTFEYSSKFHYIDLTWTPQQFSGKDVASWPTSDNVAMETRHTSCECWYSHCY